ncbi:hypothetical protein HIM_00830 [Hirsutella minnesotensis 3608]|nr:hypothetical protein HIM_00830 [Hirsutella minnesotensis 3608]
MKSKPPETSNSTSTILWEPSGRGYDSPQACFSTQRITASPGHYEPLADAKERKHLLTARASCVGTQEPRFQEIGSRRMPREGRQLDAERKELEAKIRDKECEIDKHLTVLRFLKTSDEAAAFAMLSRIRQGGDINTAVRALTQEAYASRDESSRSDNT